MPRLWRAEISASHAPAIASAATNTGERAGETRTVELGLRPDELGYWHPLERTRVTDAATFDVWVGGDATAALAAAFETTGA